MRYEQRRKKGEREEDEYMNGKRFCGLVFSPLKTGLFTSYESKIYNKKVQNLRDAR